MKALLSLIHSPKLTGAKVQAGKFEPALRWLLPV
jgi:hypothetical protein